MEDDPFGKLLDKFMEQLTGGVVASDRICSCGTCEDAYKTALKLVEDMLNNDCPTWAMQVCVCMGIIVSYLTSAAHLESPPAKRSHDALNYIMDKMITVQREKKEVRDRLAIMIRNTAMTAKEARLPDHGMNKVLTDLDTFLKTGKV